MNWFPRTSALLGSLVLCAVLGGAVAYTIPAEVRSQRQDYVNKLSAEERAALKAQFERFKKLTDAEKDRWRRFHAELAADRTGLQGELDQYINWLGTLSIPERERVRQISDPVQRALRVQDIRKDQAKREQYGRIVLPSFGDAHVLSKVDFEAAMLALLRYLQEHRPAWEPKFEAGNDLLSRARRYLPPLGKALAGNKDTIAQDAIDVAQAQIKDKAIKDALEYTADARKRRYRTYVVLIRSWGAHLNELWPDPNTDEGRAQLDAFFTSLNAEEQDWMFKRPPESFYNSLRFHYAFTKRIPIPMYPMLLTIRDASFEGTWPKTISDDWGFGRGRGQPGRDGDRGGRGRPGENRQPAEGRRGANPPGPAPNN